MRAAALATGQQPQARQHDYVYSGAINKMTAVAESSDEAKYSEHVTMLEGDIISNEEDIMESDGLRLTANDYVGLLDQHEKP